MPHATFVLFVRVRSTVAVVSVAMLMAAAQVPVGAAAAAAARAGARPATPGDRLWLGRYRGHNDVEDGGNAMAVSPDGSRVFVTGFSFTSPRTNNIDISTVAFSASTGAVLWAARYSGPGPTAGRGLGRKVESRRFQGVRVRLYLQLGCQV